ncbi:DUF3566 domain-containing protein [Couchioplanes caeruleus]|uniref:DUF3566 domain-containing protein n=1 Tax=Couchioplanes caeruleus TaxID=56438 RepID=UPI0020BF8731|nr:DUF3566 domain-containing protein [Couchioplanes caeruleus]UQU64965.1 DUF3566 domain-containing protein [Couchioplanes caeruleus]
MPETQAKSGGPGASATPAGAEPKKDGAAPAGREAAGRAAVPAEAPSPPKFTRAPGMAPPPGEPPADSDGQADGKRPAGPGAKGAVKGSATVPIVTKGKSGGTAPAAPAARAGVAPPPANPATAPQRPGEAPKRPSGGTAAGSAAVGAARVSETVRSARNTVSSAAARGPRRARLNLKRIDPWSVMKFAFAVSIVLFIVVVVATSVLYLALDAMGVWGEVNKSLESLVNSAGGTDGSSGGGFRITAWGVIGTSMLIGAVNVVLFTALATLGAFIYNVCADLVGGVELTLAERD